MGARLRGDDFALVGIPYFRPVFAVLAARDDGHVAALVRRGVYKALRARFGNEALPPLPLRHHGQAGGDIVVERVLLPAQPHDAVVVLRRAAEAQPGLQHDEVLQLDGQPVLTVDVVAGDRVPLREQPKVRPRAGVVVELPAAEPPALVAHGVPEGIRGDIGHLPILYLRRKVVIVAAVRACIRDAAVGVKRDFRALDKDKVQADGRPHIHELIGILDVPRPRLASRLHKTRVLAADERGFAAALSVGHRVIDAGEGDGRLVRLGDRRLNGIAAVIGDVGGQVLRGADVSAEAPLSVRFRHIGAAVGRRAAMEGMIQPEVDAVEEIAVGLVSLCALHGDEREDRFLLAAGHRIPVKDSLGVRQARVIGAVVAPRVKLVACLGALVRHHPDVPLLRVGFAGREAEGIVRSRKAAVFSKFCAVHDNRRSPVLDALLKAGGEWIALFPQPVHHPHELILAVGFGGRDRLVGADDQRHGVKGCPAAVVKPPLVEAQRLGAHDLIERALLIRIQLRRIGSVRGLQRHGGQFVLEVDILIVLKDLNLVVACRGVPCPDDARILNLVLVRKCELLILVGHFKAAVEQHALCVLRADRRHRQQRRQQAGQKNRQPLVQARHGYAPFVR